ncbi:MAG: putative CRISPR-associated protein [Thermogutta sp.]
MSHPILICTVGTSLFRPNLECLKSQLDQGRVEPAREQLAKAYSQSNWSAVAAELAKLPATDRICGAEINSIAGMIDKGYAEPQCGLFFLHSQTKQGRDIAAILKQYYVGRGHQPVELIEVADLQDADPKRFRSKGLRNLSREIAKIVRERSPAACAINATGGYKAQIAIGVVLGQALGLTVYYKHEQFDEVIAFPPLPVALDLELWMQASGLLANLASAGNELVPAECYKEEWDERYESLVERVQIDGREYLELSPTGQIFHETFRDRFRGAADLLFPPPAPAKRDPRVEQAGWPGKHPEVKRFMERVTREVPFVVQCATFYFDPKLPEQTRFLLSRDEIVGRFSDGRYCVKFRVETTAQTKGQRQAAVAALNEWLQNPNFFRTPQ